MHNLGLKLYSSNTPLIQRAKELYGEGVFQYIEIYVVPGSAAETLPAWQILDIPTVLHAPHSASGFNLSLKEKEDDNRLLLEDVRAFHEALNPRQVIFHSGANGSVEETVRQLALFKRAMPALFNKAIVENKPRKGLKGEVCIGASPDELERITSETGLGFCLDFGHAICFAATIRDNYMETIDRFVRLNPVLFHLSDGYVASETDNHLNFGKGNFPIDALLATVPPGSWLSIETGRDASLNFEDFRMDAAFLKR